MDIPVLYLDKNIKKLEAPKKGDLGTDIRAAETAFVPFGRAKLLKTGVCFELPNSYGFKFEDRSSVSEFLHSMAGVIDVSYTGECKVRMYCHSPRDIKLFGKIFIGAATKKFITPFLNFLNVLPFVELGYLVNRNDKVVQALFSRNVPEEEMVTFTETEQITRETERGSKGFGSSGIQ